MQSKKMSLFGKLLIAAAIIAAGAFAAVYFLRSVAQVAVVTHDKAVNAVPGRVDVIAEYATDLKSEVSGRVIKSTTEIGDAVKEGDVLVQIDTGDLDLEIEHSINDMESLKKRVSLGSTSQVELDNAKDLLKNYTRLHEKGNLPTADLERQERAVKAIEQRIALEDVSNQQSIEGFENLIKSKKRLREKMTIISPMNGTISKVFAHKGDLIGAAFPIATIVSPTRIVEAKISEENFAGIKIGQQATVRLTGYDTQYEAKVSKILPTADPDTQRYVVHLDVKIEPQLLVPGITGEVSIVIDERNAQTVVPRRALQGNYVYVVNGGRIELRQIEKGYVALNKVEILKGLKEGDLVIVEEIDSFHDGERVRTETVKF